MTNVTILQREITHYRAPFFDRLHGTLEQEGLQLRVAAARPAEDASYAGAPWFVPMSISEVGLGRSHIVWQHARQAVDAPALLILEHAASVVSNGVWARRQRRSGGVFALWGHGRNFQQPDPWPVRWQKARQARQAAWWFAYTDLSRDALLDIGVASERITVVQNAIDTGALKEALASLEPDTGRALREELALPHGPMLCFVGRMYAEKRVGFLLSAFERIARAVPGVSLVVVGDGPEREHVQRAAAEGLPVRTVGALHGRELARVLRASDAMLIPGLVGLAVLDAHCAGIPLFTTDVAFHSPEIAYVEEGQTGIVTRQSPKAYANAVVAFLGDPGRRQQMRDACLRSARTHSLDAMVDRFAGGIRECLERFGFLATSTSSPLPALAEGRRRSRIAIVTNELPPYRRPVFERLSARPGLDVTVILQTEREPHRLWDGAAPSEKFVIRVLRSRMLRRRQWHPEARVYQERFVHLPRGLLAEIARARPDVVVSGGFGISSLLVWLYCSIMGASLIVWTEETARCSLSASAGQRLMRRFLLARARGVSAWGRQAADYVRTFGVSENRITFCPQAVDNAAWHRAAEAARAARPPGNVPPVVGVVGPRVPPQGLEQLLDAWRGLDAEARGPARLWIAGDGELRAALAERIQRDGDPSVELLGPVHPERLPDVYARASLLVLPSLVEIWGLVANEAMAAGVPALVSMYCGAAEVVRPGVTGDIFDPTDVAALTALVAKWLGRAATVDRSTIQAHIEQWSIEACERAFLSGVQRVLAQRPRRLGNT